jgi:hypothetical protein
MIELTEGYSNRFLKLLTHSPITNYDAFYRFHTDNLFLQEYTVISLKNYLLVIKNKFKIFQLKIVHHM